MLSGATTPVEAMPVAKTGVLIRILTLSTQIDHANYLDEKSHSELTTSLRRLKEPASSSAL
jgi:hypothetical protein